MGRSGITGFGTPAGMVRISSSDDESSTASTPNDPPYVLRTGAGAAATAPPVVAEFFVLRVLLVFMSSMRGLGLEVEDDFPTVSHESPCATDFLFRSRCSRSRSSRSCSARRVSGQ
jgi:hypothetical protein